MSGTADAGRLLVRIEATTAQLRQQLQAAEAQTAGTAAKIDTSLKRADAAFARLDAASRAAQDAVASLSARLGPLGSALGSLGGAGLAAGAGIAVIGSGLIAVAKAGDTAIATLARLQSATGSLAAAQTVYEGLFRLSQQTGVAVAESAGAFSRFAVAAKEIGGTNAQVLQLVAGIQKAGIVAGAGAQETGAAVQQLGQALASGALQGDELRSLLENMPQLAQALARELGVGIGQLRQMGSEGKLTADKVFPALLAASEKMSAEFEKMPVTMSRAFGILGAGMEDFAGRLDKALGLSQAIAKAVKAAADAVGAVGRYVAPTEAEANAQAIARLEERRDRLRAEVAPDRQQFPDGAAGDRLFAAANANANPQAAAQYRAAEAELAGHYQRRFELQLAAQTREQIEEAEALQQAREAARVAATIRLRDTAADLDARYKARKAYDDKIKKLDEDEARGGTLPAGVTFAGLRAAAAKELEEALEKAAKSTEKVADGHKRIAKEAADADSHVKAYLKEQEKAADAVAKAQKKAAEEIERFHARSLDAVANIGERAADRLGDSLVDAFVRGEGASVNFGNVLRGVIASALADLGKLAVINPILNSLFVSSQGPRPTLGGAFGGGGLGDLLGLGSMFGGGGSVSSFLFGAPAVAGPIMPGMAALPGASAGLLGSGGNLFGIPGIGGLFQGAGIGAGIGGLTAGVLGGNSTYGAMGGAAGALIGQMLIPIPGVGALIGGLLGGAGGGLIGPKESVKGWSYALRGDGEGMGAGIGNQLLMTDVFYNESGKAQFDAANQTIAALNEFLSAQGLTVQGARAVGGNKNGPDDSWGGAASFGDALADLRFGSSKDARLNTYLFGKAFDDPAKLAEAVQGFTAAAAAIDALAEDAVPAFTAQLKAVNDNFDAASEQAKKYGLAEENLTTARAKAIAALEAQRTETLRQSDVSLEIRRLAATGRVQEAELARQAEAARLELESFAQSLDALAVSAADKAARLVDLEEVQAAERAAIIQRYGEQTAQALQQQLRSGQDLMRQLAYGAASPLAPSQRYFAAITDLNQARQALEAGGSLSDYTAIAGQVLPVARDYLGTSQRYGGLVAEISQVLAARGADAGLSQILTAQAHSTDAMGATLAELGGRQVDELVGLRREVARLGSAIEAIITRNMAA